MRKRAIALSLSAFLLCIVPFSGKAQVNLTSGLIAYYPFTGNAKDATGNGNDGIPMNGVQLTTDRFGNPNSAYLFDGIDDYILVNDMGKLSPSSVTVAAWVNTESTLGQSIIGKIEYNTGYASTYNLGTNYDVQVGFYFGVVPTGGTCFQQYPYDPNDPYAKSGGVFSTNVWHCVVGTFDQSVLKIYVDGALVDTKSSTTSNLLQCTNTQFLIGSWWAGDPLHFKGKIDEVRIYNRVLNQDEVSALCSLESCPFLQGTLTGSNICSGNTQGFLTFHSPGNTGPFTLTYTDGTNTYTQTNVQDSVPFALQAIPSATTTYTLLSIQNGITCPPTTVPGISATVTVGACSLCKGALGDPVVNVTFGNGDNPGQPLSAIVPGASTTLQYVSVTGNPAVPVPFDGQYTITNNVPFNPAWFYGGPDHTPNDPKGYMAFYNSSEQPGEFYSQTVNNLCGGTIYQFAAWIANVLNPAMISGVDPDITFIIEQTDGTVLAVYDTGPVPQNAVLKWVQYGFGFTAPPGVSTVVLKMINNSPGGVNHVGNDMAIDDITFSPCGPGTIASFSAGSAVDSISLCAGTDTVLYGNVSNGYTNPAYLWQISSDNGIAWTNIPNSNQLQIAIAPPLTGVTVTYQYRLLAAENANINSPNCRVVSNLVYLTSVFVPLPDFSFDQNVCNPLQVDFASTAHAGATYDWLIGGTSYTGTNPSALFGQYGSYPVKLKLTENGVCSDSIQKNVSILIQPGKLISTPDTTICFGKSLPLRTGPVLASCWSPATYLDNPALANPVTTPPVTTKYYFTANTLGANLVTNGDFSNGNTGFTSGYNYDPVNVTEGEYFVGPSPHSWDVFNPVNCGDHTSGNGNMLMINGYPAPGISVWQQQVNVTPNTQYAISAWIESLSPQNPATLQFSINGILLGSLIQASSTACTWQPFATTWNSGSNTTALINLVDDSIVRAGNDFALDDISFATIRTQMDSVTVTVEKPAVTAVPDTTICRGMPVPLQAGGAATYSWSPGSFLSDSTIADPVAISGVTNSYTVTGTTSDGCIAKSTVLVAVFPNTALILTPDTTICLGDPAPLQAGGGISYTWSPSQFLDNPGIANPVARPVRTTRFFLTVVDPDHCTEDDSVTVSIRPMPVFQAPPGEASVCAGSSVMLGVKNANPYKYAWSPAGSLSDPSSPTPLASPVVATLYTVRVSDAVCDQYDSSFRVHVDVQPIPVVVAQKANDIDCSIATAQLNVTGATSYAWSPAEGLSDPASASPVASIDSTTTFIVRGTDRNGCFAFDTVSVKVTATGRNLFVVPNAFSPNGDGHNDCFGIRRWGDVTIEEFSVFDRWGVRVFTTRNPSECWDGNFRGKPQEAGTYPYVIKARSFCGQITRTGVVVLVR